MALSRVQKQSIENILKEILRVKFENYKPETASMPFHTRLLGKDRMALFSFIHSLNTNFGTTIFESIALELAKANFNVIVKQANAGTQISDDAQREIQNIIDEISAASVKSRKIEEIERIRKVCQTGKMHNVKLTKIDIYLEKTNGENFCLILKPQNLIKVVLKNLKELY